MRPPGGSACGARTKRAGWFAVVAALLALLALGGCAGQGHVEGRLTYPPPQREAPPTRPGGLPPALPEGPAGPGAPGAPELPTPLGVYFLHDGDFDLSECVYLGERTTGDAAPLARYQAEQARSNAVLDLAEQSRLLGGNVVALPTFRDDFRAGRLQGRVYRCGEPERRRIYERAAAQQQLTIVPP